MNQGKGLKNQGHAVFEMEILITWVAGDPNIRLLVGIICIDVLSSFLTREQEG